VEAEEGHVVGAEEGQVVGADVGQVVGAEKSHVEGSEKGQVLGACEGQVEEQKRARWRSRIRRAFDSLLKIECVAVHYLVKCLTCILFFISYEIPNSKCYKVCSLLLNVDKHLTV
jgi:hypothetical protein